MIDVHRCTAFARAPIASHQGLRVRRPELTEVLHLNKPTNTKHRAAAPGTTMSRGLAPVDLFGLRATTRARHFRQARRKPRSGADCDAPVCPRMPVTGSRRIGKGATDEIG